VQKLDRKSNIPLHVQAETLLRKLISSKEYEEGKLLPKEIELAKTLNISRNTLRQAINRLVYEGILVRKRGYGTIVAPKVVLSNARNWMSFYQEMKAQGLEVRNYELHISWKQSPPIQVSEFFSLDEDSRVLSVERLRGSVDKPFVYFVSYFNPCIGLTGNENFNNPLYELLEKDFGITVETSKEEISAQSASPFIAEKLGINEGAPILVRKRRVYDTSSLPVEYNIGYYLAESFTYAIEFKRDT